MKARTQKGVRSSERRRSTQAFEGRLWMGGRFQAVSVRAHTVIVDVNGLLLCVRVYFRPSTGQQQTLVLERDKHRHTCTFSTLPK